MAQIRVVTDSAADLPAGIVDRLQITVVPLVVRFGNDTFLDSELSIEEFWRRTSEGPDYPATSQPSVGAFEEAFGWLVEAGHSVLCLTITGEHSGTFGSACAAARRFEDRARVVDSQSLSLGQGFQAIAAAQAALNGLSLDQTSLAAARVRTHTQVLFMLDTIEYLQRGGRAAVIMPVLSRVTRALRIKPILHLVEGRLSLRQLVRSYGRGLVEIVRDVKQFQPVESLAVVHARCPDVAHRVVGDLSRELGIPEQEILLVETGPLLSTHAGPGVIGVGVVQRS